jgi:pimeloyl-ACP methyl ester carboxylesterase
VEGVFSEVRECGRLIAWTIGQMSAGRERESTRAVVERERGNLRRRSSRRETFQEVASADGTTISFDRLGEGAPVIMVCGAMCDRGLMRPSAEKLAKHFTVFTYDRRGRGDSGDTAPYALEREIEDLDALVAEAGGRVSVYAHSSGAALALHAAAGLPIAKLVLHEPPYNPDGDEDRQRATRKEAQHIKTLLAENRRGDTLEYFWRSIGMPQEMVDEMRHTPRWAELEAMAPTMAYDSEVMGDISRGGAVPTDLAGRVATGTLVLVGGASPEWMIDVGNLPGDALPNVRYRVLEGQEHVVPPELLVPVLAEFLAR